MAENSIFVFVIGFLAQALFSARTLCQWILSEKAKKVVSPTIFWVLSIAASYLLCIYGWLRDDFSIILGQFISYYVYLWNLKSKGVWGKLHTVFKLLLALTPIAAALFAMNNAGAIIDSLFHNENVPTWLLIYGSAGQVIFTLRFVYQWAYSVKRNESFLPAGFWIISIIGSAIIISYGIFRLDPVLILGQSVGFVAYLRNIIIGRKQTLNDK